MTVKSDTRFKENLSSIFKYDLRNLVNINVSGGKREIFHFHGLIL